MVSGAKFLWGRVDHDGDHLWTSGQEQSRRGPTFALLCGLVALFFLYVNTIVPAVNDTDRALRDVLWVLMAVFAVTAAGYVPLHLYFRHLRRRLGLLAATLPATATSRSSERTGADAARKQLKIDFRRPDADAEDTSYRSVTARTNVVGLPPLRIVYFRCFGNAARTRTFLEGAWREFGHVHLLRHPDSATWRELWRHRKPSAMAELVITSEEQLRDRLSRWSAEPERHGPFGEYPVREFFCADGFWQQAADALLTMADLVVLDLSGMTGKSGGLLFELRRALSTKRWDQVLVLADEWSDVGYLTEWIRRTWAESPAGTAGTGGVLRAYVLDEIVSESVYVNSLDGHPEAVGERPRLHGDRTESRRLLRQVQHALERAPLPGDQDGGPASGKRSG